MFYYGQCVVYFYMSKFYSYKQTVTKEDIMKANWEIFDAAKN